MKILLIKTSSLGDIIQTFPTLHFLHQKFPDAEIDWVVEKSFADLVKAHPAVHRVHCVDTKTWRNELYKKKTWACLTAFRNALRAVEYDVVFDLQGNTKSGLICGQARGKTKVGFGLKTAFEWPNILFTDRRYNPPKGQNVRSEYLYLVQNFFGETAPFQDPGVLLGLSEGHIKLLDYVLTDVQQLAGERVMVCAGSAWPNKQLSPETLKDFLQRLQRERSCSFVFIWGTPEEQAHADALGRLFPGRSLVIERLPLPVLQNLMKWMDLVIAMDSLPLHLAGTTSTPTFSIFGASSAAKYRPEGSLHRSFQGPCPYGRTFERRCPVLRTCPTGACIRGMTGETIFHAFQKEKHHGNT